MRKREFWFKNGLEAISNLQAISISKLYATPPFPIPTTFPKTQPIKNYRIKIILEHPPFPDKNQRLTIEHMLRIPHSMIVGMSVLTSSDNLTEYEILYDIAAWKFIPLVKIDPHFKIEIVIT